MIIGLGVDVAEITRIEEAIARIKEVHSYTVPEIVAMPFTAGFAGYLNWIGDVTAT